VRIGPKIQHVGPPPNAIHSQQNSPRLHQPRQTKAEPLLTEVILTSAQKNTMSVHENAPTRVSKHMFQTAQGCIVLGLQKHLSAHIGPTHLRRFWPLPNSRRPSTPNARVILICETNDGHRVRTQSDDMRDFNPCLANRGERRGREKDQQC